MKRFVMFSIFIFVLCECKSINIPLDSIKLHIVSFYKDMDPQFNKDRSVSDFPNFLIYDRKKGAIEEGKEGIFAFGLLSSGEYTHFLLIGKNSFQILNMKDPIDENILKLSIFLRKNKQYSKHDVLFYIEDIIKTYQSNEEHIKSFNGVIR